MSSSLLSNDIVRHFSYIAAMTFQFVDASAMDPATRRRIRQQAAQGHNAGRSVTRRSRKHTQPSKAGTLFEKTSVGGISRAKRSRQSPEDMILAPIERPIAVALDCVKLPAYFSTRDASTAQRGKQIQYFSVETLPDYPQSSHSSPTRCTRANCKASTAAALDAIPQTCGSTSCSSTRRVGSPSHHK